MKRELWITLLLNLKEQLIQLRAFTNRSTKYWFKHKTALSFTASGDELEERKMEEHNSIVQSRTSTANTAMNKLGFFVPSRFAVDDSSFASHARTLACTFPDGAVSGL